MTIYIHDIFNIHLLGHTHIHTSTKSYILLASHTNTNTRATLLEQSSRHSEEALTAHSLPRFLFVTNLPHLSHFPLFFSFSLFLFSSFPLFFFVTNLLCPKLSYILLSHKHKHLHSASITYKLPLFLFVTNLLCRSHFPRLALT